MVKWSVLKHLKKQINRLKYEKGVGGVVWPLFFIRMIKSWIDAIFLSFRCIAVADGLSIKSKNGTHFQWFDVQHRFGLNVSLYLGVCVCSMYPKWNEIEFSMTNRKSIFVSQMYGRFSVTEKMYVIHSPAFQVDDSWRLISISCDRDAFSTMVCPLLPLPFDLFKKMYTISMLFLLLLLLFVIVLVVFCRINFIFATKKEGEKKHIMENQAKWNVVWMKCHRYKSIYSEAIENSSGKSNVTIVSERNCKAQCYAQWIECSSLHLF